jgi:hypothetical protein
MKKQKLRKLKQKERSSNHKSEYEAKLSKLVFVCPQIISKETYSMLNDIHFNSWPKELLHYLLYHSLKVAVTEVKFNLGAQTLSLHW